MPKYIFLDNWVFSLLRDPTKARGLLAFVQSRGYTVVITSLSMTELYNPGWREGGTNERGVVAVSFLARVPCVIVNPAKVWEMEIEANLSPLDALPLELDLAVPSEDLRAAALLAFLRRDNLYLEQGKDIEAWSLEYQEIKRTWPSDVVNIIENACRHGYLLQDSRRRFIDLRSTREFFLMSLDLRCSQRSDRDVVIAEYVRRHKEGRISNVTSVRLASLCFWYSYVELDKGARPKYSGSDIGDFHQISLLPYCSVFTMDGSMHTLLKRVRERVVPTSCEVLTKSLLEERIR